MDQGSYRRGELLILAHERVVGAGLNNVDDDAGLGVSV